MKRLIIPVLCLLATLLAGKGAVGQKDFVQQILLDKPVQAGKLKLFPSFGNDSNKYYYLPNKLRLATDDNGKPKFLFLQYVTNVESGEGEADRLTGTGGGYVHLVVGLYVTPEELNEAKMELKRINSKAVIMGPVIYRGGTMALVTKSVISNSAASSSDPGQKRVLGLGAAPVMEGDNIAVSFILDSLDARILWESLQTSTPDISFNLNMTLGGYQSPIGFRIDMDFDKIYKHKIFNAGVATPYVKAEIGFAAQELREKGGILVTQIGEDVNMQKIQEVILNKFLEMCFVPFGGEGSPNWSELGKTLNDGKSYLDRASDALKTEREAVDKRNQEDMVNYKKDEFSNEEIMEQKAQSQAKVDGLKTDVRLKEAEAKDADQKVKDIKFFDMKKEARAEAERKHDELAALQKKLSEGEAELFEWTEAMTRASKNKQKRDSTQPKKPQPLPSIAVVASYQQKKIRHSGHFTAESKTYFTTTLAEPFGDNIGKINCRDCIKRINTRDPMMDQRTIECYVDGDISNDFNKYVNYVTVTLRKVHGGGDITTKEVRIDRRNFSKEGNRFRLMYGWMKGDDDRRNWTNYQYKTTWSFFGGAIIERDWQEGDANAISLSPPVKKYTATIDSDPDKLKEKNIRGITVRVYYTIAGMEQMRQVTLNIANGFSSTSIDYLLPDKETEYEYEIEWLKGNTNIKSRRMKTSQGTINVDPVE